MGGCAGQGALCRTQPGARSSASEGITLPGRVLEEEASGVPLW